MTAVEVDRVTGDRLNNQKRPTVRLTEPADHGAIAPLVREVNALPASIRPAFAASCPFSGDPPPSVTLTFHMTEATLQMHLEISCWGQVEVTRDGVRLRPTHDPRDLSEIVDRLLADR